MWVVAPLLEPHLRASRRCCVRREATRCPRLARGERAAPARGVARRPGHLHAGETALPLRPQAILIWPHRLARIFTPFGDGTMRSRTDVVLLELFLRLYTCNIPLSAVGCFHRYHVDGLLRYVKVYGRFRPVPVVRRRVAQELLGSPAAHLVSFYGTALAARIYHFHRSPVMRTMLFLIDRITDASNALFFELRLRVSGPSCFNGLTRRLRRATGGRHMMVLSS